MRTFVSFCFSFQFNHHCSLSFVWFVLHLSLGEQHLFLAFQKVKLFTYILHKRSLWTSCFIPSFASFPVRRLQAQATSVPSPASSASTDVSEGLLREAWNACVWRGLRVFSARACSSGRFPTLSLYRPVVFSTQLLSCRLPFVTALPYPSVRLSRLWPSSVMWAWF